MFWFIIICIVGIILIGFITLLLIDKFSGNRCKFLCKYLGWHKEPKNIMVERINFKGTCPRCGKKVMMDSQGNWF